MLRLKKSLFKNKSLGFSLLEVLVVMALIAIATGLTINFLSFSDKLLVKSEVDKFHALCISLKYKAQLESKTLSIVLDSFNNFYNIDNKVYKLSKFVKFGLLNNVSGPPSAPSKVLDKPITFINLNDNLIKPNNYKIVFYPDGTISAGVIYFTNYQKSCQYALSISVAQVSFIRKYIYNLNQQKWVLIN